MVVSKRHERAQGKPDRAINRAIRDCSGVLTVDHEDLFFKAQIADAIGKDGMGIQAKVLEVAIAVRVDGADIAIGAQFTCPCAGDDERFFEFGQGDESTLLVCWREQAVIPPRVHADDGRAGKSADAIGLEPLPTHRLIEIAAYFFFDADVHDLFPFPGGSFTCPPTLTARRFVAINIPVNCSVFLCVKEGPLS